MAEAREGCGGAGSLEAELTCPICLGLYREPALLSCGHNFCRQCIENVLRSQGPRMCPTCRAPLEPTVKLQNNFQLGNIVEAFQATTSEAPQARRKDLQKAKGSKKGKTGVVPCEYCLDGPQPAVKTCLACDVSMCKAHLRKHNAKSFQQEHVLVEVGVGRAEDRRCPEHGKPLEFFCLREDECICVLCSIAGAHKGHEVVTMKEGRDRQLAKLSDTIIELEDSQTGLVLALRDLRESENQIKTNIKTAISHLEEQFESIQKELVEDLESFLHDIQSREVSHLEQIADARKEMEQKRDRAEQHLQALQKMKEQPDVFLFFKDLKLVTDRIASLDLSPRMVSVRNLLIDHDRSIRFQRVRDDFTRQLMWLVQDMCDAISCQVEWLRNGKEQHLIYMIKIFDSYKLRCKGEVKNRHQN